MERVFSILGDQKKHSLKTEAISRKNARRSLVAACKIKENGIITQENITWKRPAHGISPKEIDQVLGKRTSKEIEEDEVLQWNMIK